MTLPTTARRMSRGFYLLLLLRQYGKAVIVGIDANPKLYSGAISAIVDWLSNCFTGDGDRKMGA